MALATLTDQQVRDLNMTVRNPNVQAIVRETVK